ncbi:MAG TPA: BON domain-containing protein [Candidatus Bathyarchaeia archaeon]|nr:BON domain-containing protein [Candidatus Bathyarchaeia archaeon]
MEKRMVVVGGITIAVLAAAGGAPAHAQGTTTEKMEQKSKSMAEDTKVELSDTWITSKTKIALFADDRVKGRQVHVETKNGTVTLRGKVDSNEAKAAADEVTKGIEGVRGVKNELQVVPPAERKAVDADDKQIAKGVEDRFKQDPELRSAKIDAKVNAGVVTLTGEVKSITTSAKASEVARGVPGVRYVRNDLSFGSSSRLEPSDSRK